MLGDEGSGVRGFALGSFSQHNVFPRSFFIKKKWSNFSAAADCCAGGFFNFWVGGQKDGSFLEGASFLCSFGQDTAPPTLSIERCLRRERLHGQSLLVSRFKNKGSEPQLPSLIGFHRCVSSTITLCSSCLVGLNKHDSFCNVGHAYQPLRFT